MYLVFVILSLFANEMDLIENDFIFSKDLYLLDSPTYLECKFKDAEENKSLKNVVFKVEFLLIKNGLYSLAYCSRSLNIPIPADNKVYKYSFNVYSYDGYQRDKNTGNYNNRKLIVKSYDDNNKQTSVKTFHFSTNDVENDLFFNFAYFNCYFKGVSFFKLCQ